MVNKNILRIRKDLDRLDNKLLEIIKKRVKLVDLVIKNKPESFFDTACRENNGSWNVIR